MGYYIRALPWKQREPRWKVQYVSYQKSDIKNKSARRPKKEWDLRATRWRTLGFTPSMNVEEARARARQLNAQKLLKRQEERVQKLELDRRQMLLRNDAVLPEEFVREFELRFIRVRDSQTDLGKRQKTRARIVWQAAQKMIVAVNVDPSDWFYYEKEIYDHFYGRELSIRYINAILRFANLWGVLYLPQTCKTLSPRPHSKRLRAPKAH